MARARPLLVAALVFAAGASAGADAPEHPIREFDDRREGILERRTIVPGEKISLYAAFIENAEAEPADETSPFQVAFWMADSASANVLVRDFATLYQMEPLQKEFLPGLWQFSWPPDIASQYEIELSDLSPLALHMPRVQRTVYPALVFRERPVITELRYVFSLVPRVPVTLLDWDFRESESAETVHSGTLRGIPADRPFEVTWTPKNEDGEPAPAGIYDFFVRTSFQPQPGTPARKVVAKYRFHHVPEFLESLGLSE
jgi:hypothetical protein